MLALFISWLIILFVFYTFGDAFVSAYNSFIKKEERYSFPDTFLLGMCAVAIVIMFASFWYPSNFNVLIALILFCIIYWVVRRKRLSVILKNYKQKISDIPLLYQSFIFMAFLLVIVHSVLAPIWVDTSYYHIQNIMWNDQYHVVPGLANLQPRFGFNSNYYLLCSVFGLKPLFGQYIFGIHTLCLGLIFGWIIYKTSKSRSFAAPLIALFVFGMFVFVYKLHITSPSSDLLPNLLILYLFLKIMLDKDAVKKAPFVYFLIPAFCLTLKLSSFIICLFAVYVLWICIKEKSYKKISFLVSSSLLIGILWCTRTVIITGYLVFPYPAIDIFDFDWKIPVQYVIDQKDYIQSFARVDNIPMQDALAMNIFEWLPMWWKVGMFYYFPMLNRVLFILGLLSIPVMPILFFFLKNKRKNFSSLYGAWLITLGGFVFWLFSAPDFRFAYGFIIPLVFIPVLIIFSICENKLHLQRNNAERFNIIVCLAVLLFVCFQAARWVYYQRDTKQPFYSLLYKPEPVSRTKELRESRYDKEIEFVPYTINNVTIYTPTIETHCFDCDLPCGLDFTGGLEMRGETLQDGFRTKTDAPYRKTY